MLNQKKLGKSNIKISSIGFGGAEIGDLYEKLQDDLKNSTDELEALFALNNVKRFRN